MQLQRRGAAEPLQRRQSISVKPEATNDGKAQPHGRPPPLQTSPMAPVLVIGGAGYLGGHLLPMLISKGHQPVVLDDLSRGWRRSVDLHPQAVMVQGSSADRALLASVLNDHRAEAVIQVSACLLYTTYPALQ